MMRLKQWRAGPECDLARQWEPGFDWAADAGERIRNICAKVQTASHSAMGLVRLTHLLLDFAAQRPHVPPCPMPVPREHRKART
jgi:hypothetical protein